MKKPQSPRPRRAERTLAERADRHALYQRAVQGPEADSRFFERVYRRLRGKRPLLLREDFCGTAYLACTWAGRGRGRSALGVDLDPEVLTWGREHNLAKLSAAQQRAVCLVQANVLEVKEPRADLTCALNFSQCVFKTRAELRRYFEVAYQGLAKDGVFVTELYGGTEAIIAIREPRPVGTARYVWEQASYNPISHETLCYIHFEFRDGSRLPEAFRYDWRLWSIPETRELLHEVGFPRVDVYWDRVDERGRDESRYVRSEREENQESWLVYVVAAK